MRWFGGAEDGVMRQQQQAINLRPEGAEFGWTQRWSNQLMGVAEHRKHGGDRSNGSDTSVASDRDHTKARGIRRRIQKRAIAGDDQAQAVVAKLITGELSPNAAAIAAGMREKYIRISPSPPKAAKSLVSKQSKEWCLQLLDELSALVFED